MSSLAWQAQLIRRQCNPSTSLFYAPSAHTATTCQGSISPALHVLQPGYKEASAEVLQPRMIESGWLRRLVGLPTQEPWSVLTNASPPRHMMVSTLQTKMHHMPTKSIYLLNRNNQCWSARRPYRHWPSPLVHTVTWYLYARYWWLTPSKYVFKGIIFRGCMPERVISSFCLLTASVCCQFSCTPHRPPPSRENTKRGVFGWYPAPYLSGVRRGSLYWF